MWFFNEENDIWYMLCEWRRGWRENPVSLILPLILLLVALWPFYNAYRAHVFEFELGDANYFYRNPVETYTVRFEAFGCGEWEGGSVLGDCLRQEYLLMYYPPSGKSGQFSLLDGEMEDKDGMMVCAESMESGKVRFTIDPHFF